MSRACKKTCEDAAVRDTHYEADDRANDYVHDGDEYRNPKDPKVGPNLVELPAVGLEVWRKHPASFGAWVQAFAGETRACLQ